MRIAVKRLRYTLEVFEGVLPEASKSVVKELAQIQEELGSLHDSDVMIALLRLCLASQDSATRPDIVQSDANKHNVKGKSLVSPEMAAAFLDTALTPSAEKGYRLEQL